MAFSDVVKWLDGAKLTFVASADFMADIGNLPHEGQKLLSEIKHPVLWQSVRDYFVNQQFRQDVFVKGPLRLQPLEQSEALRAQAFVLTTHPDDVPMKIKGEFGEVNSRNGFIGHLLRFWPRTRTLPKLSTTSTLMIGFNFLSLINS